MMWLITAALFVAHLSPAGSKRILVHDLAAEKSAHSWRDDLEDLLEEARGMMKTARRKLVEGDAKALDLAAKWFGPQVAWDPSVKKELLRVMKSTTNVLSNFKAVKKTCDKDTFAYVFPEKFPKRGLYEMILCPLYFNSNHKVQLETLIHEASHHKKALLDDVCMDSIEGRGRHQHETKEFVVMSQNLVKKYAGIGPVFPDLQFDLDVGAVANYVYFVDPVTLEILEDDGEDDEDKYVSNAYDEDDDYDDEDEDEDEDEEEEEEEEPAVVHRIVDLKVGGKVKKNMALVQLNPADDCDDKAYGRKECASMAKVSPVKALRNADNFCYFVVDASSGGSLLEELATNNATSMGMHCDCDLAASGKNFQVAYQATHGVESKAPLRSARATYARICGC
ncbi:MEP [Symbiodinium sp. CCMP2592]|nr:MEP [Symbiodinium sp. CCMP2592]